MSKTTTSQPKEPEYKDKYTLTDFGKWFIEENNLDWKPKVYSDIARTILFKINEAMIKENLEYKPPGRMGTYAIRMKTRSLNAVVMNWLETRKRGKGIKRFTPHFRGHLPRFMWFKRNKNTDFKNKPYYTYDVVRDRNKYEIGAGGLFRHIDRTRKNPYDKPWNIIA